MAYIPLKFDTQINGLFNIPYINPIFDSIPIIASSVFTPEQTDITNSLKILTEALDTARECGFNCAFINTATNCFKNLFTDSSSVTYPLKFIPSAGKLTDNIDSCQSTVLQLLKNPNICAWQIDDEPHFAQWNDWLNAPEGSKTKNLVWPYWIVNHTDPNHNVYFNLAAAVGGAWTPENANDETLFDDSPDYNERLRRIYNKMLDRYQGRFAPSLWSYDFYPVTHEINKDGTLGKIYVREQFYLYLECYAQRSKMTNRPFYAYIMSMEHKLYGLDGKLNAYFPKPTLGSLRFQAFSALAYGAKGLVYWTYALRNNQTAKDLQENNSKSTIIEEYISAAIDLNGNKTEIWDYIKQINHEISSFNDIWLSLTHIRSVHIGNYFDGTTQFESPFECINTISYSNSGFTISLFSTSGITSSSSEHTEPKDVVNKCIIIVSHNPFDSQKIDITFRLGYNVQFLNLMTESEPLIGNEQETHDSEDIHSNFKSLQKTKLTSLNFSHTVPAGGYIVLTYDKISGVPMPNPSADEGVN